MKSICKTTVALLASSFISVSALAAQSDYVHPIKKAQPIHGISPHAMGFERENANNVRITNESGHHRVVIHGKKSALPLKLNKKGGAATYSNADLDKFKVRTPNGTMYHCKSHINQLTEQNRLRMHCK